VRDAHFIQEHAVKLSVLEQSTLSEGMSASEAVHATVTLARALDKLGYERLWLSEHHNMPVLQGSAPEVLLSVITVIGDTREEAERLARAQLYFMCAFRSGEPVQRQMLVEEAAVTDFPTRYEGLLAMFRRTWIIDDAEGAPVAFWR
jgi:alkanesulfonate monooxygenase SsuD/methylene tetrahydromethanopterin reductase-like flavin-dependent oxidoreductase (luciferase family)